MQKRKYEKQKNVTKRKVNKHVKKKGRVRKRHIQRKEAITVECERRRIQEQKKIKNVPGRKKLRIKTQRIKCQIFGKGFREIKERFKKEKKIVLKEI